MLQKRKYYEQLFVRIYKFWCTFRLFDFFFCGIDSSYCSNSFVQGFTMKRILIFLAFFTFLNADYYYEKDGLCVISLHQRTGGGWCFNRSDDGSEICRSRAKYGNFVNGFYLDPDGNCVVMPVLEDSGLSYDNYTLLIGLTAIVFGGSILLVIVSFARRF
ncbi:hypothetical protein YH65_11055 [Sulfurovum lithotrophicum]|uniref:Uncharacterized protein n=1 Tax=Sulfurovum lithotrophicum TaxID=206403 RepID=A0A7U4M2V8_9BACT|nr:hypothetical protein YH65_11055 [Sulfurovum lithotrophicum]